MTHGGKNCVLNLSRPFPIVRVIRVRNRLDRLLLNHEKPYKNIYIVRYRLRPPETVSEKGPNML